MKFMINKNTQLCGSFSLDAGDSGCLIHNLGYRELDLNFIYKSFSVQNIGDAIFSMRTLNIRGAGVAMPFKIEAIKYIDEIDPMANLIGSVNTIVNNGKLKGYNTDYDAAFILCEKQPRIPVFILGLGGLGRAVDKAVRDLSFMHIKHVQRNNWEIISSIRNSLVLNCTPVRLLNIDRSNIFLDFNIENDAGKQMKIIQAKRQFELYTGNKYPDSVTL